MSETATASSNTSADQSATAAQQNGQQGAEQQGDPAALGDAGKKALESERTARKAAEKSAADLQAQLDQINQANESAVEKAQRELKEAQESAAKAASEAIRFRVAAKHGISDEDADLFLTGSDAETVEKQAAALVARTSTGPKPDRTQGSQGTPSSGTPEQDFANFLNGQLGR